jgi:hypothetical protein
MQDKLQTEGLEQSAGEMDNNQNTDKSSPHSWHVD